MVEHPIEHISKVQDLLDLHEFFEDEKFTDALELATKVIAKPDLPVADVRRVLTLMQAYSLHFKMRANYYMHIKKGRAGTEENIKKNLYLTLGNECHEMAQTLKYLLKDHML